MKNNAWNCISPNDYDAHMSHPNVAQTQMLNNIIKEQFDLIPKEEHPTSRVAILGITNGNGLEHVAEIAEIIGIDINKSFLDECEARYKNIEPRLKLFQLDLMADADIDKCVNIISTCDLIIANLLIKHIHLNNFIKIVRRLSRKKQVISCVIQMNPDGIAVSKSGFEHVFEALANQRWEEKEESILPLMNEIGFWINNRIVYDLPNGKQFIRLDFTIV